MGRGEVSYYRLILLKEREKNRSGEGMRYRDIRL